MIVSLMEAQLSGMKNNILETRYILIFRSLASKSSYHQINSSSGELNKENKILMT